MSWRHDWFTGKRVCPLRRSGYCPRVPNLNQPSDSVALPARSRRAVLGFAATLAMITYVDRVCISQAAPDIQSALGLSAREMGLAFSAFSVAYAIFEIPGGWLGDWIG